MRYVNDGEELTGVSIHAFRGEGDHLSQLRVALDQRFNPRLPGGRRPVCCVTTPATWQFQSTPSGGKATTGTGRQPSPRLLFQSTPSGGKATSAATGSAALRMPVSIHAFRGEGDTVYVIVPVVADVFQSTPSGGKATVNAPDGIGIDDGFNPRLPGGRRQHNRERLITDVRFQSTPSGGKATGDLRPAQRGIGVSIHAFRGEGDSRPYSRCNHSRVSIHAFRGEGDIGWINDSLIATWFQSTPSGGKATGGQHVVGDRLDVSIHAFRGEGD